MGRFTLRDEGKTIAVGKVLKYKPVKVNAFAGTSTSNQGSSNLQGEGSQTDAAKEEQKQDGQMVQNQKDDNKEDLIYDLDSGQMLTREEYNRRNKEKEQMEGIDEEDEDEDDEDGDDEEEDDEDDEGT